MRSSRSILIATGLVGNVIEWYDFVVYGYFAQVFAKLFFPSHDPVVSLILSFLTFAVGFLARPFGALLIGYVADKKGRKPALVLSIYLMAIPSLLIMVLPTYHSIGVLSSIILGILRIFQGLSAGGEYTTSVTFLLEHSHPKRRAFYASINLFGAILGILFGSFTATVFHHVFSEEELLSYAWRLIYLPTLILAYLGVLVRKRTYETPSFVKEALSPAKGFPLVYAIKHHKKELILTLSLSAVQGVAFFTLFVYLSTYYNRVLKLPSDKSFLINTIAMLLLDLLIPFVAYLSDKHGRSPFFLISLSLYAFLSTFLINFMLSGDFKNILLAHLAFAFISSLFMSILPATLAELFPVKVRGTSFSVLYNTSLAVFGGTVPMVCTYFVEKLNLLTFPGIYLSAVSAFALLLSFLFLPETNPRDPYEKIS